MDATRSIIYITPFMHITLFSQAVKPDWRRHGRGLAWHAAATEVNDHLRARHHRTSPVHTPLSIALNATFTVQCNKILH
jgi:sugar phosphate isomerase/epimerase